VLYRLSFGLFSGLLPFLLVISLGKLLCRCQKTKDNALSVIHSFQKFRLPHVIGLPIELSRTGRKYSSSTISKRLKELVEAGALEETPTSSQKGRIVGYRITNSGKKALELSYEYEEKLGKVLK